MRKLLIYIVILVLICFLIPVILTPKEKKKISKETALVNIGENIIQINTDYDYGKYNNIKFLHTKTGEVQEIKIDEYLYGVVASEMPANFDIEALKAQATVARTYTIYKAEEKKHENANICDDFTCCQAWISKQERIEKWEEGKREEYWNKIIKAVNETKGKIIIHEGKPINALFHSNSGGNTELPINVWGGENLPYFQTVETLGENEYTQYSSELILSKEELLEKLKQKYSDISIDFNLENPIEILEYTESGRIRTIKFGNKNLSGVEVRTLLGLKSTNFIFEIIGENIKFSVTGYGHGVGMSQTGADSLARQGKNYEEIIKHFYFGVDIRNAIY